MITNFDYLKNDPQFSTFANVAISAEKIILIDPEASILNSRRAMEFAIKWMYSVDSGLEMPYQDNLQSLMNTEEFRQMIGPDLWKRMDYIRRSGNNAAHSNKKLGRDEAMLCLENLFIYLDYVACCYSKQYKERSFDKTIITSRIKKAKESKETANAIKAELAREQELSAKRELDLQKLIAENASLKEEISARRQEQQQTYVPKPLDLSEYKTRKLYIDSMLMDAGWTEGKDWINEVELPGMPNKSETGFADYVLYDDMHRPLAIIEAKRTCVDVSKGRQQAKLYADLLGQKYKRRPVIFLTNGFDTHMLPDLSCTNLVEEKDNYNAHCVFSTYQTMINCIDTVNDNEGKLFTCGHFDLVICDEAHRSIYNKYRDIFSYFDAPLIGLTATPKDEIDKNTYEIFELENGVPTYGYDLAQAVKDGYLVDYVSVESKLKFIEQGIVYDELSEEDKEAYEETFEDEHGNLPESINSSALNTWIFNEDTIKQVLNILMTDGIKIDYGQKLGKTIIFAKNHDHAEKIREVFNKEYPHLPDYAKVIDNYMTYAQSAIDEFSDSKKMSQIAISVDMLDTGIDVPEVLNLVFFKKVMSKAKFWQMIGRGTRLCPGLLDGEDKQKFYIFDFCGNFEFFRMNKGKATANMIALQGAIFNLKFEISYKLQDMEYQIDRLIEYRKALVKQMSEKVRELPRDNFAVRQHLKYVDLYSSESNYNALTYEDTLIVREEVAPLILPDGDEASAVRFDALMYGIELAYLVGKKYSRARTDLRKKVAGIANVANIPEIQAQSELVNKILNTDYVDNAGINEFEEIREKLRDLMKYIPKGTIKYVTNFTDELLSMEWKESELENDELKNYKAKAEYYIRQHQDNIAIAKLKTNRPLTSGDLASLEEILWREVGTKQDYEHEFGSKPLGEFVREIVGLDMNAAKEAFSEYLTGTNLDSRQIYFVNQIVEYIVHNGMMKDLSVLLESPFTDRGSVAEVFTDLNVWLGIRKVIDTINANAAA